MLETNDIGAGHFQLHQDALALDSNVQPANAMLMRPKLAVLFCSGGGQAYGEKGRCKGELMQSQHFDLEVAAGRLHEE